jgi:hypothetical protein
LRGKLAANPVSFLGEDNAKAGASRCQSRRAAADASADDHHIGPPLGTLGWPSIERQVKAQGCRAGQRKKGATVHAVYRLQAKELVETDLGAL